MADKDLQKKTKTEVKPEPRAQAPKAEKKAEVPAPVKTPETVKTPEAAKPNAAVKNPKSVIKYV